MKGARPLGRSEVRGVALKFQGAGGKRDLALFLLGINTGFRISELLSLKIGDFILGSGRPVKKIEVKRRSMKGKVESRAVIVDDTSRQALQDWLDELPGPATAHRKRPLFWNTRDPSKAVTRQCFWATLKQAFEEAGVQWAKGTHAMRKTFANYVYEASGKNLYLTQRALGHKNVGSTSAYLSFKEEDIDAIILGREH